MRHIDYYELWVRHSYGELYLKEFWHRGTGEKGAEVIYSAELLFNWKEPGQEESEIFISHRNPLSEFCNTWMYYTEEPNNDPCQ
jgi:hypothetical protein